MKLFDFISFLFKFVCESFHFGLLQILRLLFVFFEPSRNVIFAVIILSDDKLQLMCLLSFNLFDFVFQKGNFPIEPLIVNLGFSLQVLNLEVSLLHFSLQFIYVQLLELVVAILRPFQILNLINCLILIFVLQCVQLNVLQSLHILQLVMEPADLGQQFIDLNLMFLVLDIEMIENFSLFHFSNIGVIVFPFEPALPGLHLSFLLLDQFDQTLIFIHEVWILCKKHFNFLFKFIHPIESIVE